MKNIAKGTLGVLNNKVLIFVGEDCNDESVNCQAIAILYLGEKSKLIVPEFSDYIIGPVPDRPATDDEIKLFCEKVKNHKAHYDMLADKYNHLDREVDFAFKTTKSVFG